MVYSGEASGWEVSLTEEVEEWFLRLSKDDPDSAGQVAAAIDLLAEEGPSLGRPLVDHVKGSDYKNMKELRPGSAGDTEIRILFAFDPQREAILLVAGDKAGNWKGWYETSILEADQKFTEHLRELKGQR
ncbi:type II toxin-antitoxin system RelE/ParE family toxin [Micromonospora chalcea]|uniref:type II toxin-antitoxin system RelE/ParE family toxin n=1 Tax=Micromonospora sp. TSRI0369 TaxID=1703936 RepID=UPI00093A79A5|nr:type II toxin-antitoxin system RelE/ParE family toxin [Micromonospora sp. TSRI0369]OKJ44684.1 addiction module toxin RelE [Micromonospora sp. TSRI0369]